MLRRIFTFATFIVVVTSNSLFAAPGQVNQAALDNYLATLNKHQKANLAVMITRQQDTLYKRSIGLADETHAITDNTLFRVGSISKTYTAALIMKLCEMEKLSLDTKLASVVPGITNGEQITIRQMLSHRSGIASYTDQESYQQYMYSSQTRDRMLERIKALPAEFTPGEKYSYSNSNYYLLGHILEVVAESSYADLLRQFITAPLGLNDTYDGTQLPALAESLAAKPLAFDGSWQEAPQTDLSVAFGAGHIVATASDVSNFINALYSGLLLSKASVVEMYSVIDNYGLGIIEMPFYQARLFGHNGAIDTFQSSAVTYLQGDTSFVVFTNGTQVGFNDVMIAILSAYFDREITVPDFDKKAVSIDPTMLEVYTGTYSSEQLPLEITVFIENDKLMAQATGQGAFPLTPYGNGEFRFDPAGIKMVFNTESLIASAKTQFVLHQGGQTFSFNQQ